VNSPPEIMPERRVACERSKPNGPKLSAGTERRIELLFQAKERANATELLVSECGYNVPGFQRATETDIERIRFAALKLSEGNLSKLNVAIELANLDARDLLMEAGFGEIQAHQNWVPEVKR
jgi:hypothetical protein